MRIVCLIATFRRYQITVDTIRWVRRQRFIDKVVLVGSCGQDLAAAKDGGARYLKRPNHPLGNKWQEGLNLCRSYNPDGVLICGSDDWLSQNWIEECCGYLDEYDVIGKRTWYAGSFTPNEPPKICRLEYVGREDPVGAGRLISSRILDKCDWQIFPKEKNSTLDHGSYQVLKKHGAKLKILESENAWMLSIKSNWDCITSWHNMLGVPQLKINFVQDPMAFMGAHFHGSPYYKYLSECDTVKIIPEKKKKSVPVALLTYNRLDYFRTTLGGLKKTKADRGLVIFDDCSDDPEKRVLLGNLSNRYPVFSHGRNLGSFMNTKLAIEHLYCSTTAPWFIVCQDDIKFSKGWVGEAAKIVDSLNRSGTDWGILSLINLRGKTEEDYYILPRGNPGGALWVVNREMWKEYRRDENIYLYEETAGGTRHLSDQKICHWCTYNNRREWAVCHVGKSLALHVGAVSSISGKDMSEYVGKAFVGENDAKIQS